MGRLELQALLAKRTGYLPDPETHVEVKPSGPKEKKPLRKVSLKKQKENRETIKAGGDPRKVARKKWYDFIAQEEKARGCMCWECGREVPDNFILHATAHIFPKEHFQSVETHPLNYLILPASCCHDKTHVIEKFKKMKIWEEAVDRFIVFEPLLTDKERRHKYYRIFLAAAQNSFPKKFLKQIPDDQNL